MYGAYRRAALPLRAYLERIAAQHSPKLCKNALRGSAERRYALDTLFRGLKSFFLIYL